jgi:hypothetical protein
VSVGLDGAVGGVAVASIPVGAGAVDVSLGDGTGVAIMVSCPPTVAVADGEDANALAAVVLIVGKTLNGTGGEAAAVAVIVGVTLAFVGDEVSGKALSLGTPRMTTNGDSSIRKVITKVAIQLGIHCVRTGVALR